MPVPELRAVTRDACRKYIVPREGALVRRYAPGSPAKTFRATTRHNRKACGRRSRLAAKRGALAHKNKTEKISADARSDSGWRPPIVDDREGNRASRHRSKDRPANPDRFATARACAR